MVVPVLATRTDRTRFRDQHRRILVGTPQPPRVTDLVRQAQQGDQTAFQSLYREHVGRVYALCLRLTADASEAEELTQDAFVRAWERLATFRGESAFSSWLYRLTVNVVFISRPAARRRATCGRRSGIERGGGRAFASAHGCSSRSQPRRCWSCCCLAGVEPSRKPGRGR